MVSHIFNITIFDAQIHAARKEHLCTLCKTVIKNKERYHAQWANSEGWFCVRLHLDCIKGFNDYLWLEADQENLICDIEKIPAGIKRGEDIEKAMNRIYG